MHLFCTYFAPILAVLSSDLAPNFDKILLLLFLFWLSNNTGEGFLLSSTTQRKGNAQNNKNKKSRPNVSDEEVFDDQKVSGLGVEGIQQMSGESQATSKAGLSPNSQATSKAGLSFDSLATFGSDQLKVIVPDEVLSVSSTDSSPRHHKPAANHQEDWNDADGKSD